jgi:hypothetical protein
MNKSILASGIIILFIFSAIAPLSIGYTINILNNKTSISIIWQHQEGWPVTIKENVTFNNYIFDAVVCDLENDGNLDIVVTYSLSLTESYIDAYNLNGSQKTNLGFPFLLPGKILSEVSIGDLDNNGYIEIVACVPVYTDDIHTSIFVFEYDGEKIVEAWHFMESRIGGSVLYSPSLGDIDGDGDLEIIRGNQIAYNGWFGIVYALHHDGTMVTGWPVIPLIYHGSFYATPALGDIDNDGFLEVVVGSYFKYLYAWNANGRLVSFKWPVEIQGDIRSHSPQLGDLDGDGKIEIVQINAHQGTIYIIDGQGNVIRTINPDIEDYSCTPALCDIDGDSDLEIFVDIGDYIYGWHHDGEKVSGSWPVFISNSAKSGRSSIIIGDINDDQDPDILFMCENSEEGSDIFALHVNGTLLDGWPYTFNNANYLRSSPTLIDIDKDGDVEVVFTYNYLDSSSETLSFTIDILDLPGSYDVSTMHWPMFQHDLQNTGLYCKPLNNPPEKPIIDGPINGILRTELIYNAITSDPNGDNISYLFNWGDGTNSGWTEFVTSGISVDLSHSWLFSGTYTIKVKAKDDYGMEGAWGVLEVNMPRDKAIHNPLIYRILEQFTNRFQILQNLFGL